jgi:uncharacterized protein YdaU (DUF1376 family)
LKNTNVWMSLLIGDVLKDIQRLDNEEVGILFRLWVDHWLHGSLPAEIDRIMRVGNVAPENRSNAQALLKHFFQQQEDGTWIAEREAAEKARAERNSLINHERAKKAALARWGPKGERKTKRKPEAMLGALPEALLELCPSPSPLTLPSQAQEEKQGLRPPPLAGPAPAIEEMGLERTADVRSMAVPAATHRNNLALSAKPNALIEDVDRRRADWLRGEVRKFWGGLNGLPAEKTPWTDKEDKAVIDMLRASPGFSEHEIVRCLEHRSIAVELGWLSASLKPSRWLRDLPSFLSGPLDKDHQLIPSVRGEFKRKGGKG